MWQFEHKSRTPDANEPHAGYRDTPGFVEFLDLTNTAVVEQDQSTKRLKSRGARTALAGELWQFEHKSRTPDATNVVALFWLRQCS